MNNCKDILIAEIDNNLKPKGFFRKGKTWRKSIDGIYWVFEIQKSDYSNKFYVNIGIYVYELGGVKDPPSNKCHIQVRLTDICDESQRENLDKCLDCEVEIGNEGRAKTLRAAIITSAMPFYENFSSIPIMYQTIMERRVSNVYPRASLTKFLSEWKGGGT